MQVSKEAESKALEAARKALGAARTVVPAIPLLEGCEVGKRNRRRKRQSRLNQ